MRQDRMTRKQGTLSSASLGTRTNYTVIIHISGVLGYTPKDGEISGIGEPQFSPNLVLYYPVFRGFPMRTYEIRAP